MPIQFENNLARFSESVDVEEAEVLLEWLQAHPKGQLDLADCVHLHAANLQVLMAAKPDIIEWPKENALAVWLKSAESI